MEAESALSVFIGGLTLRAGPWANRALTIERSLSLPPLQSTATSFVPGRRMYAVGFALWMPLILPFGCVKVESGAEIKRVCGGGGSDATAGPVPPTTVRASSSLCACCVLYALVGADVAGGALSGCARAMRWPVLTRRVVGSGPESLQARAWDANLVLSWVKPDLLECLARGKQTRRRRREYGGEEEGVGPWWDL